MPGIGWSRRGLYSEENWFYWLILRNRFESIPQPKKADFMTAENDIVLIHYENQPLSFARIEAIEADVKPHWYQVRLLLLQVPLQVVTWILREAYINGEEFTMNGKRMRLEKVVAPADAEPSDESEETPQKPKPRISGEGKIISLKDLKKK